MSTKGHIKLPPTVVVARATGPVAPPIYYAGCPSHLFPLFPHFSFLHSSLSALSLLTTFSPFRYLAISFLVTKLPAPNGEGPGEGLSRITTHPASSRMAVLFFKNFLALPGINEKVGIFLKNLH